MVGILLVVRYLCEVRFQIIGNVFIKNVGKSQSCMVSKLPIVWKQSICEVRLGQQIAVFNSSGRLTRRLSKQAVDANYLSGDLAKSGARTTD